MHLIEHTRIIMTPPAQETRPVHIYDVEIRARFEDGAAGVFIRGPVATQDGPEECALRMFAGSNAERIEKGLAPWDEYDLIRAEHVTSYVSTIRQANGSIEFTSPAAGAEERQAA